MTVYKIVEGDLFDQKVECLVSAWNMNFIPFFLLWPHGVAGQMRKKAGWNPFWKLWRYGVLKAGSAVITDGGKLSGHIIHVAGLHWYWVSSYRLVELCTRNALELAEKENVASIAFPLIGAGVGGMKPARVQTIMERVFQERTWGVEIILVKYKENIAPTLTEKVK